jgi:hypothetical protein
MHEERGVADTFDVMQQDHSIRAATRQVRWIAAAWALPVVLLVLPNAGEGAVTVTALFAAVISCVAIVNQPCAVLVALPFFALLSPVAGFFDVGGVQILLSDGLFVLLGIQLLVLAVTNRVQLGRSLSAQLGTFIALFYVLSTLVGALTGTLISLKPLLYIVQLAIIGLYTKTFAITDGDWKAIINSWLIATGLGAVLLINAFLSGRSLSSFEAPTGVSAIDRTTLEYLFRADYYYTGFHFAVGLSIVILLFRVLLGERSRQRIASVVAVVVLTIALLMMLNKTAILSIALTLVIVFTLIFPSLPRGMALRTLGGFMLFALGSYVLISKVLFGSLGEVQQELWGQSAVGTSSLGIRLSVYVSALDNWTARPIQVLLGMGPDFLDRSGDLGMMELFRRSSATGLAEGTVDSGWISYLIELGVISFVALATLIALATHSAYRRVIRARLMAVDGTLAVTVFAGLVFVTFAMTTQMLGYTKVTWFPFQLLVIALMRQQSPVSDLATGRKS